LGLFNFTAKTEVIFVNCVCSSIITVMFTSMLPAIDQWMLGMRLSLATTTGANALLSIKAQAGGGNMHILPAVER
jgi:hypothetical protein